MSFGSTDFIVGTVMGGVISGEFANSGRPGRRLASAERNCTAGQLKKLWQVEPTKKPPLGQFSDGSYLRSFRNPSERRPEHGPLEYRC